MKRKHPRHRHGIPTGILAFSSLLVLQQALADDLPGVEPPPAPQAVAGKIIVKPSPGVSLNDFVDALSFYEARFKAEITQIDASVWTVSAGEEQAIVQELNQDPLVDFAEREYLLPVQSLTVPNDPKFDGAWHLHTMNVESAWPVSRGQGVKVAVLDTGFKVDQPDLVGRFSLPGYNAVDGSDDISPIAGHGTSVAGVIGAATDNGIGVASIAPGVTLLPVRVSNETSGAASTSDIAAGLTWAADHGARVANISYSVTGSYVVGSAAQYMHDKGGLVVVAAGNTGGYVGYQDSPYMVSVSSTDKTDVLSGFSSYGSYVDVAAPGRAIWTTTVSDSSPYQTKSGTSFASPATAAVAALVFSADPGLSPDQVEGIIKQSAVDLGDPGVDQKFGSGRVDAAAALALVAGSGGGGTSDQTAPTVGFQSPQAGSRVSGLVSVSVNASDDTGLSRVELFANGTSVGTDNAAPWGFTWNSAAWEGGSVTLTARATDTSGNSASASRSVQVADVTAPVVNAPADIRIEAEGPTTVVGLGQASASDNVDGALNAVPDDTGPFSVGTHTVTWAATDAAGNTGSATQRVVVTDSTPPDVTAPPDVSVMGSPDGVLVDLGQGVASDLVDGDLVPAPSQSGWFQPGTYSITWRATDAAGNTGGAVQTVVVLQGDSSAPQVTAPPDISVEATGPETAVALGQASAYDDQDGTLAATPSQEGPFAVGRHEIVWSAKDSAGNTGSATQIVEVSDTTPPSLRAPADLTVPAAGYVTGVDLGQASASDRVDGDLVAAPGDEGPFPSGLHEIVWTAADSAGNRTTAVQRLSVVPQAVLGTNQTVGEGSEVTVEVSLSGVAPAYPVEIPYSVGGSATPGEDHDASDGVLTIASGTSARLSFHTLSDAVTEGRETVVISLGQPTGAVLGSQTRETVTITDDVNEPPRLYVRMWQGDTITRSIDRYGGPARAQVVIRDPNPGDTHTIDWGESASEIVAVSGYHQDEFIFDPSNLAPGGYKVRVRVADSGTPSEETGFALSFNVEDSTAPQAVDGDPSSRQDTDFDGIADIRDAIGLGHVQQGLPGDDRHGLMQTLPGLGLHLGALALGHGDAAGIRLDDLAGHRSTDAQGNGYRFPAGILDFEIEGVEPGASVPVVIAQQAAIPAQARYLKHLHGAWQAFVEDAHNRVSSAAGDQGACPAPGSDAYRPGLAAGHRCVQILIQDGGPNDADGEANGLIVDPSAVAVQTASAGSSDAPSTGNNLAADGGSGAGGGGGGGGALGGLWLAMLAGLRRLAGRRD